MRELVPDSVDFLDGRTLADIPATLVPRSLWSGKPQPIDQQVSGYLYPGDARSMPEGRAASARRAARARRSLLQGELYWNLGLAGVVIGSAVVGVAMGLLGRLGRRAPASDSLLTLYAVAMSFVPLLLTRSFAAMTGNLVLALIGTGIAVRALSRDGRAEGGACGAPATWPARHRARGSREARPRGAAAGDARRRLRPRAT